MNGNKNILILFFICLSTSLFSQSELIDSLFRAQNTSDSSIVDSVFNDSIVIEDTFDFWVVPYDNQYDTVFFHDSAKKELNIGLALPLLLDSIYSEEAFEHSFYINNPVIKGAFDIYTGMHMAFDSLKRKYPFIHLNIYDSSIDTFNMDSVLKDSTLKEMDVMFGPLLDQYFTKMVKFCHDNQIYVISPLQNIKPKSSVFYRNSTPSLTNYYDSIALYIQNNFDSIKQKVIINPDSNAANLVSQHDLFDSVPNLKKLISNSPKLIDILDSSTIEMINDSVVYKLGRLDHRIVFINSTDESFVYRVFSQLEKIKDSIHFSVIGLPSWEHFSSINVSYYNSFNVLFGSTHYINYKDPRVINFRYEYIKRFKIEPSKYAYLGYDNLMFHVEDLISPTDHFLYEGLSTQFEMTNIIGGVEKLYKENRYFHLIQFMYGQIIKLQ